jgi:FkbM family methyltransferase
LAAGTLARLRGTIGFVRAVRNWPRHYLARRRKSAEPLVYELRNGLRLAMRPNTLDAAVFKEVFVRHLYGPSGFEIGPADVVIDIGAHIGCFSIYAAHAAREGRVIAFEPAPANFALLTRNLALNALTHVLAQPCAVSGEAGERELRLSLNTGGHSFHSLESAAPVSTITVSVVTLAEVVREHGFERIDLLKMDCEGEEYEILERCPRELLQRIRRLAMEVHDLDEQRNAAGLARWLAERGFVVRHEPKPDRTAMLWAQWPTARV